MKLSNYFYFSIAFVILTSCTTTRPVVIQTETKTNFEKLASIKNVVSIEKRATVSHFDENYEIWFEQPVDYDDLSGGTFRQKVLLGYENGTKPVFVELQGYAAFNENAGELASHYQANQLTIEHRYFTKSRPDTIDWNTLTVKNAAKDQERIINAIRSALYPESKFISTGISKGCQTVMLHRSFFPENVDACVCYVGPLNLEREDPRVYEFLKNVSSVEDRAKVKAFQETCFQNKSALLEILIRTAETEGLSWEFGPEKALEYSILEYSFAFWQWGTKISSIPDDNASPQELYNHLIDVVGYGFFERKSVDGLQPYFWAALTEQGIYGYETAPFKQYLGTEEIYKFDWAFPDGHWKAFNPQPMQNLKSYLDNAANKMLFIYGEYDAWSATAVDLTKDASERQVYKYVQPKGDHTTRIKSFSLEKQREIYSIIDQWLVEK
jgi:hypothetical protein